MRKYLRLYWSFIRVGFIADLEYRANFIFRVITDVIWYAMQILSFEVLYQHTGEIGGWPLAKTRVFLGVLFVTDSFYMIVLNENLDAMTEKVRKGELDLLLAKPVNSQFMTSLQKVSTSLITNFFISAGFLCWSLWQIRDEFDFLRLAWLILLIPCGLVSLYATRFFIATLAVLFTKADNIQFIWYQFYRLGMRPDVIYPRWLKWVLRSVLPVALVAAVPAEFVLQPLNLGLLAWMLGWTAFLVWATQRFWRYALTRYSSASS